MRRLLHRVFAPTTFKIGLFGILVIASIEISSALASHSHAAFRSTDGPASPSPTPPPSSSGEPASDIFLNAVSARRANLSSDISIKVSELTIKAREMNLAWGKTQVLSVPVEIRNNSRQPIHTMLSHEWYGGVWPPTNLLFAVNKIDGTNAWESAPAYQVGEKGSTDNKITLKAGESISVDIRLNWPGTGSVPAMPLIDESTAGKYSIKFLLFFKRAKTQKYTESPAIELEVHK